MNTQTCKIIFAQNKHLLKKVFLFLIIQILQATSGKSGAPILYRGPPQLKNRSFLADDFKT
jgi:hypothetical protein